MIQLKRMIQVEDYIWFRKNSRVKMTHIALIVVLRYYSYTQSTC